jgi:leucyl/phenylalanyl-tRNA--protein transferase
LTKIIDTKKLIELYKKGYFPMAENASSDEINLYRPEKRFIIPIDSFHIPKKLFTDYKRKKISFKINENFSQIIDSCSKPRPKEKNTWINVIIKNTYIQLFNEGFAKSIECFEDNTIIGGLYGVHINGCFFGESMFSKTNNASKFCLLFLISILKKNNFALLDSQYFNSHLIQFGAYEISNKDYQLKLEQSLSKQCIFPTKLDIQKSISILQLISQRS